MQQLRKASVKKLKRGLINKMGTRGGYENDQGCRGWAQIGPPKREEAPPDPKEVFNYAGQKKLDLGFGAAGAPVSGAGDENPLAWETLRKVCPLITETP